MRELMQGLRDASIKSIRDCDNVEVLESLRVKYLGKKGELTTILRQMGKLSAEERPAMGQLANQLRADIESAIDERKADLTEKLMELKLESETVDVTLPGEAHRMGHKHPMYNVLDQIKDIFIGMGFEILDGPEVELADYNFTKLNIDEGHPSREWTDTFYFTPDSRVLLRTQTSNMQVHAMETRPLPIRVLAPGRVYRKDEVDATHSPMFHQIEGLVVDKGVTMADLKATLNLVVEKIYGKGTVTRFRPHHFPFTEPSCELDIQCHHKGQQGRRYCHDHHRHQQQLRHALVLCHRQRHVQAGEAVRDKDRRLLQRRHRRHGRQYACQQGIRRHAGHYKDHPRHRLHARPCQSYI